MRIRYLLYRPLMRLAHRFNWHYAPPIYPEGDTQLWCKWCGFRETIRRADKPSGKDISIQRIVTGQPKYDGFVTKHIGYRR